MNKTGSPGTALRHKDCGGELYIMEWTVYPDFGFQPDYYCWKCGEFIAGDSQIEDFFEEASSHSGPHSGLKRHDLVFWIALAFVVGLITGCCWVLLLEYCVK